MNYVSSVENLANMISIAETTSNTLNYTVQEKGPVSALKTVVICGSCGAQELVIDENKTECPHCDDYIY